MLNFCEIQRTCFFSQSVAPYFNYVVCKDQLYNSVTESFH